MDRATRATVSRPSRFLPRMVGKRIGAPGIDLHLTNAHVSCVAHDATETGRGALVGGCGNDNTEPGGGRMFSTQTTWM